MTSNPTTSLTQLPQAVARLLDAIAANPDYQRDGTATYEPIPSSRGRWQAGGHTCGNNTINTAASNKLITIELAGPNVRTLALTPAGLSNVQARQARKVVEVAKDERSVNA
ncbi:hypothetical protein [Nonomuraea basaltis]|uniref:hypothetical protein n=1 Tax=Nonomuraea basaltis TaxID=2495887 RepID=UPI00110C556C|nr:hypothetical protein [Nonomuraea basaltis]TMR90542.1 hypothetical protein EJK15_54855 [Nonomuraea basaltis]